MRGWATSEVADGEESPRIVGGLKPGGQGLVKCSCCGH